VKNESKGEFDTGEWRERMTRLIDTVVVGDVIMAMRRLG
jgi:hypothetical protein